MVVLFGCQRGHSGVGLALGVVDRQRGDQLGVRLLNVGRGARDRIGDWRGGDCDAGQRVVGARLGQGQHIAVFELQPFLNTDIETFDSCFFGPTEAAQMSGTDDNISGSRLSIIPVDGGLLQPGPGSENDEATLDIEDVSAMAPEADIDVYEAPNTTFGSIDQYAQIVNSDVDQIVTSSWAECEQLTQLAEPGIQEAENFLFDPDYLSLYRSENCIFIQLIFLDVASPEQKAAFYKAVVDQLHEKLQVRPEDVFFNLITVQPADWSMGNGQATYINGVPTDRLDPNSVEG